MTRYDGNIDPTDLKTTPCSLGAFGGITGCDDKREDEDNEEMDP
jgi:hypothetical protein